jgi:hypothetical protein
MFIIYPEVLLFEKDVNTIGVAVDNDKNGIFETTLSFNGDKNAKLDVTKSGDANYDDNIRCSFNNAVTVQSIKV